MKKILIISHGEIGTKMAGTGIRYHYMAEVLSKDFDVTVGFFGPEYLPDKAFKHSYAVKSINVHHFHDAFEHADIIITMWASEAIIDFCNAHNKILIFDIYAPVPVETLALKVFSGKPVTEADEFAYESSLKDYRLFLENGDAFLCSNRQQLDFWLGYAFGASQVTPKTYTRRNIFNQFLLAPMGIDTSEKLSLKKPHYKGIVPGITKSDTVIIWNGGIYDWYDGITLMDAMKIVWEKNPRIKLVFPGTQHPNKTLPKWQETVNTQKRAKVLGIENKNVFFFKTWVDYHKRLDFLLEADMAIYTHKPSIESEFSHRTRVLDHILAKLPTIATQGDYFAELIEHHDLGITVPPYNKDALAEAILTMSQHSHLQNARDNIEKIRDDFDWRTTLKPLVDYIHSDPVKVARIKSLRLTPLQNRKLGRIKRILPKSVKKIIVLIIPRGIRKKLLGFS